MVECLEQVLQVKGSPPESLNLNNINIESWGRHGSGRFGLLLALAGIPVTRNSQGPMPWTVC
jgi:hypothetical protein